MSNTYFLPSSESSLNIDMIVPCCARKTEKNFDFPKNNVHVAHYLEISNELRLDVFVNRLAAVECVLFGERSVQRAGDPVRRELDHQARHGEVAVQEAEVKAPPERLGRLDRGEWNRKCFITLGFPNVEALRRHSDLYCLAARL